MKNDDELSIIQYILDNNSEYGTNETELFDKIAANYSCKAAVKAGDKLEINIGIWAHDQNGRGRF